MDERRWMRVNGYERMDASVNGKARVNGKGSKSFSGYWHAKVPRTDKGGARIATANDRRNASA